MSYYQPLRVTYPVSNDRETPGLFCVLRRATVHHVTSSGNSQVPPPLPTFTPRRHLPHNTPDPAMGPQPHTAAPPPKPLKNTVGKPKGRSPAKEKKKGRAGGAKNPSGRSRGQRPSKAPPKAHASDSGASGRRQKGALKQSRATPANAVAIRPADGTPSGDGGTSSATSLASSSPPLRRSQRRQHVESVQHIPSPAHGLGISVAADAPTPLPPTTRAPPPLAAHAPTSSPPTATSSSRKRPRDDDGGDDAPQRPVRRIKLTQRAKSAMEDDQASKSARRKKGPSLPLMRPSLPPLTALPKIAVAKSSRTRSLDAEEVHRESIAAVSQSRSMGVDVDVDVEETSARVRQNFKAAARPPNKRKRSRA